ncbi:ABC transporter permease [Micromonospora sediminimaris]|uniref:Dipeptide-transport integral membrane protein ABC transporter DppB n=1 Tax=Micromonospora sediminimaris TaxID=547162 RepID=A0A9W5XM15_9ACTN|nr:ABC transporter permease [Micromonospora sediminimaris]GIJ36141.1 putative dipeptide-transport integral membrane protein ABC transporter DppB [Micromonospora sediminimaris]SFC95337.1 peptide/nickel transport system permease protein/oligopeptide transport system permease protein [Micromonospora sediminimaris]
MGRYVIRRLLQFIPTVLGTMFLLHYMTSLAIQFSGNPVRALFGDRTPDPALLAAITERLGYGDPCLDQRGNPCFGLFLDRLQNIFFHFDFGINLRQREVTDLVADAIPFTLKLLVIAIVFEAVVGIAAGVLAGLRGGSFTDYLVKISTVFVISVPIFVLGLVVREFVGVKFGNVLRGQDWIPDVISSGMFSPGFKPDYPFASLIIPGMVLGAVSLATTARLTRTSIMENIRADYVRTAKAKGLTNKRVIGVHTLRNSLIPVITFLGVDIGAAMAGAVVTETIFNVPGIGRLVTMSARTGESSVVVGVVTMLVLVVLLANLLVDLLYAVLDPRIRYE